MGDAGRGARPRTVGAGHTLPDAGLGRPVRLLACSRAGGFHHSDGGIRLIRVAYDSP